MIEKSDLDLIGRNLSSHFDDLRDKNIFITGGTGFFGKWIIEAINYLNMHHHLNVSVVVLSRNPQKSLSEYPHLFKYPHISFVEGDVRNFDYSLSDLDYIIHAATDASASLNRNNPELMYKTIVEGAINVTRFANSTNCKRLLYTSSGAAYGPQPIDVERISEDFIENSLFNRDNAYATAKLETESYFRENLNSELILTRCFSFAGPYLPLDGEYAFGNFINNRLKDEDIVISGDGSTIRSYLYSADLVIWLFKALLLGRDRGLYNIGSPSSVSILELARKICGQDNKVKVMGLSSGSNLYVPCVEKAIKELNVDIYTPLDEIIDKTLRFYGFNSTEK